MDQKILTTVLCFFIIAGLFCALPQSAKAATEGYYTYEITDKEATITSVNDSISGEITIPNTLGGYPVTAIGDHAFGDCNELTAVTIPDGVTYIGYCAFEFCTNLHSITIPDTVSHIDSYAFSANLHLTDVYYQGTENAWNIILIHESNNLLINANIHTLPTATEGYYTYKVIDGKATIVSCDSSISGYVTIPETLGGYPVTAIGSSAFSNCTRITTVTIPDNITKIGDLAFAWCKWLFKITLPNNITKISDATFGKCASLPSITIPDGVTVIEEDAFFQCDNLNCITLPNSIVRIESGALPSPHILTDIYYAGTQAEWDAIKIAEHNELETVNIHFSFFESNEAKVTLRGRHISFDQPPIIENGRTLVPLRAIFEALGAEVVWDGSTRTINATKNETNISLQIDSNEMNVNSEIKFLDVPAKIINERTMVPARAIAEAFGCNVTWDAKTRTVAIS